MSWVLTGDLFTTFGRLAQFGIVTKVLLVLGCVALALIVFELIANALANSHG